MKVYLQRYLPSFTHYSMCQYAVVDLDKEYTKEELDLKVKQAAIAQLDHEDKLFKQTTPEYDGVHQDTVDTITIYTEPITLEEDEYLQLTETEIYTRMNEADREKAINSLS